MIRAEQALHEILSIGIGEEPHEVLMLKSRALVETFKADSLAFHKRSGSAGDTQSRVARDVEKLRDLVDREIDRRVDEDLADNLCDLLEHLSTHLHGEVGASPESSANGDAHVAGGKRDPS